MSKFFSIAIPTWEINGKGVEYLDYSLNIIAQQSFTDFEVVVSDHSQNNDIKDLCEQWRQVIDIKYYKNDIGRGVIGPNLNNAILKSTGKYIKILFQDDFLFGTESMMTLYEYLKDREDVNWLVTSCAHTDDGENLYDQMYPVYNDKIYSGYNTISCPTVLTIKNQNPLLVDESYNWLVDCVYYKALYDKFGLPHVINDLCVINRNGEGRTTNTLTEQRKQEEIQRALKRYTSLKLNNVTIAAVAGTKAKETLKAIKYSMRELEFERAILITPEDIQDDQVEIIKCEPLNYEQYNHFIVYRLHEYIDTTHCLLVQNDGYVVNPHMWKEDWMKYDYIGALWPMPQDDFSFKDSEGNIQRMGNGGFTLRSKKLLCVAKELDLKWKSYYGFYHEDGFICCHNRSKYELAGCKFAPIEVAAEFSHEEMVSENYGKLPFGFHGRNNYYYVITQKNIQ